ncbi:glycosyltransferase involved in cell wall biosynthesis [Okibacterium sp. HSC-33S16]|uniref:glycosyltransferase n=1 Tax=Okibacterium sp. HSC-33S16 TaxID=2910965 RepID=UPI0020A19582|nr:glycosyltransferase [Okibacterium sp. HSC-33S16]MCP2032068.1 glycosyltransferase involved in cell wall biosynthesis [Okibacterium sp. HSC-33S16]
MRMSVVIPAHNEETVLPRLLTELRADATLSVVVSANACTDDTVAVARAVGGDTVQVIATETPSKTVALNAGDVAAGDLFPRAYVDADVIVSVATLRALADALAGREGPFVAAPRLRVDTSASSWPARAHYRIWALSDFRLAGHVGSGIYAVTAEGRARFGAFPDVIADDRYVQQLFSPAERITVDAEFVVRAPATLRAHIRRATRIAAGNRQLVRRAEVARAAGTRSAHLVAAAAPPASSRATGYLNLIGRVAVRPHLWPAFLVYCVGYGIPLLLATRSERRGQLPGWNRDETSRA